MSFSYTQQDSRTTSDATDTLLATDLNGVVGYGVTCAITLPAGFPAGRGFVLYAAADGVELTISPSGGETVSGSPITLGTNQAVRLVKTSSTAWRLLQSGAGSLALRFLVDFSSGAATLQPQSTDDPAQATWVNRGSPIAATSVVGTVNASGLAVPAGAAATTPSVFVAYAAFQISAATSGLEAFIDTQAGQWSLAANMVGVPALANTCVGVGFCVLTPGAGIGQYGGIEKTGASVQTRRTANNTALGASAALADLTGGMLNARFTTEGLNAGNFTGVRSGANDTTGTIADSFGTATDLVFIVWATRTGVTAADTAILPTNVAFVASRLF